MTEVVKNEIRMAARDGNQLAAFLNNGWKIAEEKKSTIAVPENVEKSIAEGNTDKEYTKSEISRMKTDDLKALAPTLGIEVTEESTGAKLKEEIIAKLGL